MDGLDDIFGPAFEELNVRQIIEARDIGEIMCKEMIVTDHYQIQACNLNRRSLTIEKLIGWLETVCYM